MTAIYRRPESAVYRWGASLGVVSSFYTQVDENTFDSSPHTAGPWSPEAQHGGPPSALMVRQIEQFDPRAGHRVARVGVDLLRRAGGQAAHARAPRAPRTPRRIARSHCHHRIRRK